jgi:hypothetical protein
MVKDREISQFSIGAILGLVVLYATRYLASPSGEPRVGLVVTRQ